MKTKPSLNVASIFSSIDGEVNAFGQGIPATFIRLAGCNLRCWQNTGGCDTPKALVLKSGTDMSVAAIMEQVISAGLAKVTITGGEPLLQSQALAPLLICLAKANINISIETNGTLLPDCLETDARRTVGSWVYDHKCPATGEHKKMLPLDVLYNSLGAHDYIKFVISDITDYKYAVQQIKNLPAELVKNKKDTGWFGPHFAFSTKAGSIEPAQLIAMMLSDKLSNVQFNLQLHKYIWPNAIEER